MRCNARVQDAAWASPIISPRQLFKLLSFPRLIQTVEFLYAVYRARFTRIQLISNNTGVRLASARFLATVNNVPEGSHGSCVCARVPGVCTFWSVFVYDRDERPMPRSVVAFSSGDRTNAETKNPVNLT